MFRRPEDLKVVVKYLNPSFLVKKGNVGFRLVTAFTDVGCYSKPQPSLMPDVDSTALKITCWKYIIVPGVIPSPPCKEVNEVLCLGYTLRGVRVYTRCAMGIPGSETALEELMRPYPG